MSGAAASRFRRIGRWIDRIERGLLTLLVTGMVALAALQILLRNAWNTGLPWIEPLLGMGLLWLTMMGALAAAGLGRHLAIDLAAALLPRRAAAALARAMSAFGAVVCVFLAWAAGRYVGFQRDMALGELLGLPVWKHYMAVPIAFWLIALRFALHALLPAGWLPAKEEEGLPGEGRVPS